MIAPKGRVPCTTFTKFISLMRVLSPHNCVEFGCFISINDKIINNLLRWGRFQPNFRQPRAAKLWTGPKKYRTKWWTGLPLSPCNIWWKSRDARRRERTECDVSILTCVSYTEERNRYRLDVRPSVCPSVTRWYCIKTAERIVMISSPHDSRKPIHSSFVYTKIFAKFWRGHPLRGR